MRCWQRGALWRPRDHRALRRPSRRRRRDRGSWGRPVGLGRGTGWPRKRRRKRKRLREPRTGWGLGLGRERANQPARPEAGPSRPRGRGPERRDIPSPGGRSRFPSQAGPSRTGTRGNHHQRGDSPTYCAEREARDRRGGWRPSQRGSIWEVGTRGADEAPSPGNAKWSKQQQRGRQEETLSKYETKALRPSNQDPVPVKSLRAPPNAR